MLEYKHSHTKVYMY